MRNLHSPRLLFVMVVSIMIQCMNAQVDSLWRVWHDTQLPDSSRLQALQTLAWRAVFESPDSGITLARIQLEHAIKVNDVRGRYDAYTTIAAGSSMKSDHKLSLEYLQQCLDLARTMDDPRRISNTLSNMSNACRNLGDLPMALGLLQQSISIDAALGNDLGLAGTYNNMGNIHMELGDPHKALVHYQRSDSLYKAADDVKGRAQALMNLGGAHIDLDERVKAVEELMLSRELYLELGSKLELGMVHNNLGLLRGRMGEYEAAKRDLAEAARYLEHVGNKRPLARTHYYWGEILLGTGQAREAITACKKGLEIATGSGLLQQKKECNECLMKAYEILGDHRNAFLAQQAYFIASDSIARLNNSREVTRLEVTRSFQERQIADSLANVRASFEQELAHQEQLAREQNMRNMVLFSSVGTLLLAAGLYNRLRFVRRSRNVIQMERDRSDELLHNILPRDVAAELKSRGTAEARQHDRVTVLFTDLIGFTSISTRLSPAQLVEELNSCFSAFDAIMDRHGLEKIKTIGDAYMAAAGLGGTSGSGAVEMVLAALEMQEFITTRHGDSSRAAGTSFQMRAGIHTGPVVAGIVGSRKFAYDIWGDTVNVASRMEGSGVAGMVNISSSTYELVRNEQGLHFTPRGRITVKGKGDLEMFFVRKTGSLHDDTTDLPDAVGRLQDEQEDARTVL